MKDNETKLAIAKHYRGQPEIYSVSRFKFSTLGVPIVYFLSAPKYGSVSNALLTRKPI